MKKSNNGLRKESLGGCHESEIIIGFRLPTEKISSAAFHKNQSLACWVTANIYCEMLTAQKRLFSKPQPIYSTSRLFMAICFPWILEWWKQIKPHVPSASLGEISAALSNILMPVGNLDSLTKPLLKRHYYLQHANLICLVCKRFVVWITWIINLFDQDKLIQASQTSNDHPSPTPFSGVARAVQYKTERTLWKPIGSECTSEFVKGPVAADHGLHRVLGAHFDSRREERRPLDPTSLLLRSHAGGVSDGSGRLQKVSVLYIPESGKTVAVKLCMR